MNLVEHFLLNAPYSNNIYRTPALFSKRHDGRLLQHQFSAHEGIGIFSHEGMDERIDLSVNIYDVFITMLHSHFLDGFVKSLSDGKEHFLFCRLQQTVRFVTEVEPAFHCHLEVTLTFHQDVLREVLLTLQKFHILSSETLLVVERFLLILLPQFFHLFLCRGIFRHRNEDGIIFDIAEAHLTLCRSGGGNGEEGEKTDEKRG